MKEYDPFAIQELINASQEMIEAYTHDYDGKWMCEDGWGKSRRKSWEEDKRVHDRLKIALENMK